MSLATYADVATRLGRSLSTAEQALATSIITSVEGQIVEVSGKAAPSPAPAYYKALCVEKAVSVISRPEPAIAAESLGQHSVTYTRESDDLGVFLSEYEERQVRRIANNRVSASSRARALPHDAFVTEDVA